MAGQKFIGVIKNGVRSRDITALKVERQSRKVNLFLKRLIRHQHFQLRAEQNFVGTNRIEKRLHASAVAKQHHFVLRTVVDSNGKHTDEAMHTLGAPLRIAF